MARIAAKSPWRLFILFFLLKFTGEREQHWVESFLEHTTPLFLDIYANLEDVLRRFKKHHSVVVELVQSEPNDSPTILSLQLHSFNASPLSFA